MKKLTLIVFEAIDSLEKVHAENGSCTNLSFQIGYLKLAIGLGKDAIENFTTAITKSDDDIPKYFIWKGIALCMSDLYEEALHDFRTALTLDPTCYEAGLYKGRCYLHCKEVERAMNAFKNFLEGATDENHEEEIKYYLGNFFFHNGLTSHARQLYEEALESKVTARTLRELIKLNIVEKNLFLALDKLELMCTDFKEDIYVFDKNILLALRAASTQDYSNAERLLTETYSKTTKGFVFGEADIVFYIGVIQLYQARYETSRTSFEKAHGLKYGDRRYQDQSEESIKQSEVSILNGLFSEETDEDEFVPGDTFTWIELDFNIGMSYFMQGKYEQAKSKFEKLKSYEPIKPKAEALVSLALHQSNSASELAIDPALITNIFPHNNRLCGIFNEVTMKLKQSSACPSISFRLSFCLPTVELPTTEIKAGMEILEDLSITSVENRPEAPWIKRNREGIVFTNNIIENEATEVRDVDDLLRKISTNNDPINTKIKLNAGKIFKTKMSQMESKLDKLKQDLMLDKKTNDALNKLMFDKTK